MAWHHDQTDDRTAGDMRVDEAEANVDAALDQLEASVAWVRRKIAEERREADR